MAKPMTLAQLVHHILSECPRDADKAIEFLTDRLGRFQLQSFRRGQRSTIRQTEEVFND